MCAIPLDSSRAAVCFIYTDAQNLSNTVLFESLKVVGTNSNNNIINYYVCMLQMESTLYKFIDMQSKLLYL